VLGERGKADGARIPCSAWIPFCPPQARRRSSPTNSAPASITV
jgi:hypothetical protein